MNIYIIIIINAGSIQRFHIVGVRRGKTGKHSKVGVKRKCWVLAHLAIPHKETGGSQPGWNHGTWEIDHLMQRRTQGVSIIKG